MEVDVYLLIINIICVVFRIRQKEQRSDRRRGSRPWFNLRSPIVGLDSCRARANPHASCVEGQEKREHRPRNSEEKALHIGNLARSWLHFFVLL